MNPISTARTLSLLTTTAIAKKLSVSRQYVTRLEQGFYDKPNDDVLRWVTETINRNRPDDSPVTANAVLQLYKEWQWQRRESTKMDKILRPLTVTDFDRMRQPDLIYYHKIFTNWRRDYWSTAHAFCVDLCVHPSPVANYEDGQTTTMPKTLKVILKELNLLDSSFKTEER